MLLGLVGVAPRGLDLEVAAGLVEPVADERRGDGAFEHVEPDALAPPLLEGVRFEDLLRRERLAVAAPVPEGAEQHPRHVDAEPVDEHLSQEAHRVGVEEQHPAVADAQRALVLVDVEQVAQVDSVRRHTGRMVPQINTDEHESDPC